MSTRLRLEVLEGRDVPAVTIDSPAEAYSWVLVNEIRSDPAGFADRLDKLRRGQVESAFGFKKADPVWADLQRLISYSTWPAHYAQALQMLRSSPAVGPLGWDDILEDRAGDHSDWMRTHAFEHTAQDHSFKTYIPGYRTSYQGGDADTWGYDPGRYYWWGEDIGYTYGLMSNSKAAYVAGRFGRIGFEQRAAFIDTISYVLEVNSPNMAHLKQLLAPDSGPDNGNPQFNAIGMDLDFHEGPYETRDGLGEATISTHRLGLYRPGGNGGFLTGILYRDDNSNGAFDAGEGVGSSISVSGPVSFTETLDRLSTDGVFSHYLPNGNYTVSATAADGIPLGSRTLSINGANAWFEFAQNAAATPAPAVVIHEPTEPTGLRPTMSWTNARDAIGYQVRLIDVTAGWTSMWPGATSNGPSWSPPSDLISGHTYKFMVRALYAHFDGAWSNVATLKVATPTVVSDVTDVTTLRPTIRWSPVPGAVDYGVYISFGANIVAAARTGGETFWTPPADLVSGRTFVIRVRAINARGFGNWNPPTTLSIAVPELYQPIGHSIAPMSLAWTAIDGTSRYVVELFDRAMGCRVAIHTTTGTEWTQDLSLVPGRSYLWRVKALNSYGTGLWTTWDALTFSGT
jgi:hypothetical protein